MSLQIEEIERTCLRLVVRAIRDFHATAERIFQEETDLPADIAEDVTREALDTLGLSRLPIRLFGKIDYKRAALIFMPDRETAVALMVDSKAEKSGNTATIQMSQTSMEVRQFRSGQPMTVPGGLQHFIQSMQTVTIIVQYVYQDNPPPRVLKYVQIACIPSGVFQDIYNPDHTDSIWLVGRNAPTLGEDFRVRLSFTKLKNKSPWRVEVIQGARPP